MRRSVQCQRNCRRVDDAEANGANLLSLNGAEIQVRGLVALQLRMPPNQGSSITNGENLDLEDMTFNAATEFLPPKPCLHRMFHAN
jgi:hypothetical protein